MSKSTPINQLPATTTTSATFVNDQQRQMVSQALQAAQQFNVPQSTQLSNDVAADDDATIQEVLNQLNAPPPPPAPPSLSQQQQPPPAYQQQETFFPTANQMNMLSASQNMQPMLHMPIHEQHSLPLAQPYMERNAMLTTAIIHDQDLKSAVAAVIAFVIVSLLPIERFIYAYVSLDKIPYSNLIVKSLLCGVLVYVIKKLV